VATVEIVALVHLVEAWPVAVHAEAETTVAATSAPAGLAAGVEARTVVAKAEVSTAAVAREVARPEASRPVGTMGAAEVTGDTCHT